MLNRAAFALVLSASAAAFAQSDWVVIDNHPSGGPGATGGMLVVPFAALTPPESGCPDYHLHGFAFGHADPAPMNCGHGIGVPLSMYYSSMMSQNDFNSIQDGIMARSDPWSVYTGQGAVILGDGALATGPIGSNTQVDRLLGRVSSLLFPSDDDGVVRKGFKGKRVMRFAGKEFVDKGFGWKQTYGPGAGKDMMDPEGWVRPYSTEDDILEDIWDGLPGTVDEYVDYMDDGPEGYVPPGGVTVLGGYPGGPTVGGYPAGKAADGDQQLLDLRVVSEYARLQDSIRAYVQIQLPDAQNNAEGDPGPGFFYIPGTDTAIPTGDDADGRDSQYFTPRFAGFQVGAAYVAQDEPAPQDDEAPYPTLRMSEEGEAAMARKKGKGSSQGDGATLQYRVGGPLAEDVQQSDAANALGLTVNYKF